MRRATEAVIATDRKTKTSLTRLTGVTNTTLLTSAFPSPGRTSRTTDTSAKHRPSRDPQASREDRERAIVVKISPHPIEFDYFLPWACVQLHVSRSVNITRNQQTKFVIDRKSTRRGSRFITAGALSSGIQTGFKGSDQTKDDPVPIPTNLRYHEPSFQPPPMDPTDFPINLETTYANDSLVQLKFNKCFNIPSQLFTLLTIIAKFHRTLDTLTIIKSGLSADAIKNIGKLILESSITDVIIDGVYVPQGNFYILLDNPGCLSYLSLCRCRINDEIVKKICDLLKLNSGSSKTLNVLNLSSNHITDEGAKYIGECLRTNRKLKYLNLTDNKITDLGAKYILKSLVKFELNDHELAEYRSRRNAEFMNALIEVPRIVKELKQEIIEREKSIIRRPKSVRRPMNKSKMSLSCSIDNFDSLYQRAMDLLEACNPLNLDSVVHPFARVIKNSKGIYFAIGNNSLSSLSLSYNELTYFSLPRIVDVLQYQAEHFSPQHGLVRLQVDGNPLPECQELLEIDNLLNKKREECLRVVENVKKKRSKINMKKSNYGQPEKS